MAPPCEATCNEGVPAVFGWGNANADVHLIGDHPGVHGGETTGIPFTGRAAVNRLLQALETAGLIELDGGVPSDGSLFMSYLHMCCVAPGATPSPRAYADLERFFDAELRAVSAHVLLPVGPRAITHVLRHFTAIPYDSVDPATLHARELAGSGFLVVPIADPITWEGDDAASLIETLSAVMDSDYTQEADLTRFFPSSEQYLVR